MPKYATTRRALLTTAAAGAAVFALASPAHATVTQNCINTLGNQYTLCVSYNTASQTPAANVQRHGSTVTVDLALQNANGTVTYASGRKALSDGQWYGIFKTPLPNANYCAFSSMAGGRVCLR